MVITLYIAKFPEDDTDDNSVYGDPLLEQHQISAVNVGVSSGHESLDSSMPHSLVARQDSILGSDHSYKSLLTSLFIE